MRHSRLACKIPTLIGGPSWHFRDYHERLRCDKIIAGGRSLPMRRHWRHGEEVLESEELPLVYCHHWELAVVSAPTGASKAPSSAHRTDFAEGR
jgi:hypothetical protein